jgi:hypothetical protein
MVFTSEYKRFIIESVIPTLVVIDGVSKNYSPIDGSDDLCAGVSLRSAPSYQVVGIGNVVQNLATYF